MLHHSQRVFPNRAEVIFVLRHVVSLLQLGDNVVHGSRLAQQFHRHHGVLAGQHLVKLVLHSLLGDDGQALDIAQHSVEGFRLNLPTITTGEADTA